MEKAYKFRLYPNKPQRRQIAVTIAAARWVYNKCLEPRIAAHEAGEKAPSKYDLMKMIKYWKEDEPWLREADNKALKSSCEHLVRAYDNFFRRVKQGNRKPGFPRFKSCKTAKRSYRTTFDGDRTIGGRGNIEILNPNQVKLPKLGAVRCKVDRRPEGRILSATVHEAPSGRYYVSILCTDVPEPEAPRGGVPVLGVDAGIHDLMVRSDDVRVPNPKRLDRLERALRRAQRRLSRMQKGSANREKQRMRVARLHERVADARRDAINKATTEAVMAASTIAAEDLNVRGMMGNHRIARAAADASMGEMLRELEYKCGWYGRNFVKVGRFYPSSKTCHECGHVNESLTLSQRSWTCPECGARLDRDLNAALNIASEGARILEARAAGGSLTNGS